MTTFLDPLPVPSWAHDIPDAQELPPLVEPAPHADAAYSAETRALLDAGRDAIARYAATVDEHEAWMAALAYVPDWARPMGGAR